jgi:hypothetical protein
MLPSVATEAIVDTVMGRTVLSGLPSSCAKTKRGRRATETRKESIMSCRASLLMAGHKLDAVVVIIEGRDQQGRAPKRGVGVFTVTATSSSAHGKFLSDSKTWRNLKRSWKSSI